MTALDSLACFSCGTIDHSLSASEGNSNDTNPRKKNTLGNMLRASISRRTEHLESPPPRARSQERWTQDETNNGSEKEQHERSASPTTNTTASSTDSSASSTSRRLQKHQRAMSDPFDAQEQDGDVSKEPHHVWNQANKTDMAPLPTLPRYPVSATRNRNCWSEPQVDIFKVRSKEYLQNGKQKITSGPYLMQARGCDLLLLNSNAKDCDEMESGMDNGLSMVHDKLHMILEGRLRSEPTLAINFQFPWGVMVLYWHVPEQLAPYMSATPVPIDKSKLSIPEQTLAKWLMGDNDYKNERLKLIPFVAEGPWVVRKLVTGTPAIIGKKLPVNHVLHPGSAASAGHYAQQPLLMSTLDIGSGSATAKRIVSVCRRYMSALTVDIGLVIQGDSAEELPEQMLGSIRIHGPDPLKALHIAK